MRPALALPSCLTSPTSDRWLEVAKEHLDELLIDHAYCEQKAAASALALIGNYPGRSELVRRMIALAHEELRHFDRVFALLERRGVTLSGKRPDPYVQRLRAHVVRGFGVDRQLTDELLVCAFVEARSCERFAILAQGLEDPELAGFFEELHLAESRHHELFIDLAKRYCPLGAEAVDARLRELAVLESRIVAELPLEPRMH